MLDNGLLWQSVEDIDATECLVITEDRDSDALTDALDDAGVEWRLH